jgi:flagellar basal body rod protein FlgB
MQFALLQSSTPAKVRMGSPSSSNMLPVRVEQSSIDLRRLAQFPRELAQLRKAREGFNRLHEQVVNICNDYAKKFPELSDEIKRLRLEIRNLTKGTPVTEAQDSPKTIQSDIAGFKNSELQNVNSMFLKKAYRILAQLTHPDRGGDPELFDEVHKAYKARDIVFLTELYITLHKSKDPFWVSRSSKEWIEVEKKRPAVNKMKLQSTPEFVIAHLHMSGNTAAAESAMRNYMQMVIAALIAEYGTMFTQINQHKPMESNDGEG